MKKIIVTIIACLMLTGCGSQSVKEESKDGEPIEYSAPEEILDTEKESKLNEAVNEKEENTLDDLITQKQQEGMVVLEGIIRVFLFDELLAYQGNPNVGYTSDETFYIFILDTPQSIEFVSGDGQGMRTGDVTMIQLATTDVSSYVNQHVTVAINPKKTWFPSDVSLPLGEPRSTEYEILGS